ncbi:septal ring lytic transglycosylase RlpA family protein [Nibribacter ruber]|uniref:Probable endolytic peptidoglycan transglycosylase RlpA n=1 Tax=Nibribacter ruber TaxID=2698458 RepID=A0A6P1NSA2_9BACT|nr:septal ring lytic transglycosylase RlpA family protein [Nibribacter ruber]QHL86557.1 septal ring lytic transglycosylase RlpA family protein [Nibribacter ruber]
MKKLLFLFLCLAPLWAIGDKPFQQWGKATFYASHYEGRPTTSGEKYDPALPTAAHAYLPLHSYVKVHNLSNGQTVVVKINDRMSRKSRFVIDLSKSAAQDLQIIGAGSAQVKITGLSKEAALAYWEKEKTAHEQDKS